jgi:glycosyltransferase involved in cell wall biosynthesis
MDEIWVPSEWQREIFAKHNIPNEKIVVIPEAVDSELFHPKYLSSSFSSSSSSSRRKREREVIEDDNKNSKRESKFEFLTIFAWSYRKGWDILLESYFKSFSSNDNVVLRIYSTIPDFIGGDKNITKRILEYQINYLKRNPSRHQSSIPIVLWENIIVNNSNHHGLVKVNSRMEIRNLLVTCYYKTFFFFFEFYFGCNIY